MSCSQPESGEERGEPSAVYQNPAESGKNILQSTRTRQSPDPRISPAGNERNEHSVVYQNQVADQHLTRRVAKAHASKGHATPRKLPRAPGAGALSLYKPSIS